MLMIVMMAMLAFSVDLGYVMTVQSELKRATDSAALAGAGTLVNGVEEAQLGAFEFLVRNPVGSRNVTAEEGWQDQLGSLLADYQAQDEFEIEVGHWQPDPATPRSQWFVPSAELPSTIRVAAAHHNAPFFFARVFGRDSFDVSAESIARFQPRDIVLVLDFSGSMNDDSELKRISGDTNRARVEANLQEIYGDLSSPDYGDLSFEPQYTTLVGQPPLGDIPQIAVTFRRYDVVVASTKALSNVVLQFENGARQKFTGLSGSSGTFRGTGDNYNRRVDIAWVLSGPNYSGDGYGYGERFEDNLANFLKAWGLTNVPYPYPSGNWDAFRKYCRDKASVRDAGYRRMYGYMTLINYWLEDKAGYSQTPDLWKVGAQPITAVKDASTVFMDYIREVDTDDRVSLVIYNSPSQAALVEHPLTGDFEAIADTIRHRQAGHYDSYTNIGAGIQYAREVLADTASADYRSASFKMIVLMTDGIANRPSGVDARQFALDQAELVADHRWPIVTIALGDEADVDLMKEIAKRTNGACFRVPGGGAVVDYETPLKQVFRSIANHRPLVLVK